MAEPALRMLCDRINTNQNRCLDLIYREDELNVQGVNPHGLLCYGNWEVCRPSDAQGLPPVEVP